MTLFHSKPALAAIVGLFLLPGELAQAVSKPDGGIRLGDVPPANKAEVSIAVEPERPRRGDIFLPASDYGGYIVVDKKKKQVVCWASRAEGQQCADAKLAAVVSELTAKAARQTVAIKVPDSQQAGVPVAIVVAAVACAGAGYVAGSLEAQQHTVLNVDAADTAQAVLNATAGTVTALAPAGKIVRAAMPHAGFVTRSVARLGIAGAICAASAGAGYEIYHFFFRRKNDIGAPAR